MQSTRQAAAENLAATEQSGMSVTRKSPVRAPDCASGLGLHGAMDVSDIGALTNRFAAIGITYNHFAFA